MAKESCLLDTNKEVEEEREGLGPVIPLEAHPNDLSPQQRTVYLSVNAECTCPLLS